MSALDPKSRALLDAYRTVSEWDDRPSPQARAELEAATSQSDRTPRAAAWLVAGVALVSTAAASVVVWRPPEPHRIESPAPLSSALNGVRGRSGGASTPRAPTHGEDRLAPVAESRERTAVLEPDTVRAPRREDTSPEPEIPKPPATDDDLSRELAVLRKARNAMRRGAYDEAAEALREHGREFAFGQLAEDREALWVIVRCSQHARNTGRAAFEATHPSSHHLVAIRAACDAPK